MNEKILIFESRELCYHSADFFLKILGEEFKKHGITVEYARLQSIETEEEKLRSYIGKNYLAVLDINSDLTLAYVDDKKDYYLNLIQAPFYHIILDHPIHLHEKLMIPLRNYHVICIDENHAQYIKTYYPHIKDVFVSYYGGIAHPDNLIKKEVFLDSFSKRSYDILFPATYIPESYFQNALQKEGKVYFAFAEEILAYIKVDPLLDTITAYQKLCREKGLGFKLESRKIYHLCLIDRYIRTALRNQLVTEVLKSGKILHVVGANWELYSGSNLKNLVIHKAVSYQQQRMYFKNAKLLLNIQPLFTDGPHDRILNGMMNQNVVFTDPCQFLKENFTEGTEYLQYERNCMDSIPEQLHTIWQPEKFAQTAWNGYVKAANNHTWQIRTQKLLSHIFSFSKNV